MTSTHLAGLVQPLAAAHRQPFPTLRATSLQNQATVLRAHPHQKTVRAGPAASIGLKSALTLHDSLSVSNEPSMLSKRFEGCQRVLSCVTVAVLHRNSGPTLSSQSSMRVWSLTKLFHSCGKNCGNPSASRAGVYKPQNPPSFAEGAGH
jgi:hypothetical protein